METTKEIIKINGKQYMTINAIAEASGIARDSLTNRFYRFKKTYPEHTCYFGSKIPVYYDEYILHQLVESTKIRPIRVIEDMDKYEKFYKTYKSKTYEVAEALSKQTLLLLKSFRLIRQLRRVRRNLVPRLSSRSLTPEKRHFLNLSRSRITKSQN